MRKSLIAAVALLLLGALAAMVLAEPDEESKQDPRRAEVIKRLEMMRLYKLVEYMNLNSNQSAELFPVMQTYDRQFRDIMEQKEGIYIEMYREVRSPQNDGAALYKKVDQILELEQKAMDVRVKQYQQLRKMLDAQQTAKFMLFERKFQREMHRIVDDVRTRRKPANIKRVRQNTGQ